RAGPDRLAWRRVADALAVELDLRSLRAWPFVAAVDPLVDHVGEHLFGEPAEVEVPVALLLGPLDDLPSDRRRNAQLARLAGAVEAAQSPAHHAADDRYQI